MGAFGEAGVPPHTTQESSPAKLILHVDADAFYASVEQALRPELKGRAVIVGGSDRGVVSAASYEARKFGVHSAMPMARARWLCPHAVICSPNFTEIRRFSRKMFEIMRTYSPLVEETSVDEGYVDITGTLRLHRASPWEVAHRMLCEIRSTLDINVSGGLAGTKTAAKMATGLAKPNGLLYLEPHLAPLVLGNLPTAAVPGVGEKAEKALRSRGITTVRELAEARPEFMKRLLGEWGGKLIERAAGSDDRPVHSDEADVQKSYSKDRTLEADTGDYAYVRTVAHELAQKLVARLRSDGTGAATVTLKIRYADFTHKSCSMSLKHATDGTQEVLGCIDHLFWKTITRRTKIRQVGVKLSGIEQPVVQANLFDPHQPRRHDKDRVVDRIRSRFGFDAVRVCL